METFETIRQDGRLLYEYVRGSHAYGLDLPTSDIDTGGVYIASKDSYYGMMKNYVGQINDEHMDNTWYEIGKYIECLVKSNPTMLESLFVPDRCIRYIHPAFQILRDNRDIFVTKACFNGFTSYAISQIGKAKGLNKKINNPMTERKTPLDFCWTFNNKQGTMPLKKWLDARSLKQKYCGLNHMPNMEEMYGLFYDFEEHLHLEYTEDTFIAEINSLREQIKNSQEENNNSTAVSKEAEWRNFFTLYLEDSPEFAQLVQSMTKEKNSPVTEILYFFTEEQLKELYHAAIPKGYHGIQREDGTSNEIRLDSIKQGEKPLCVMHYNRNGYQMHCRQYREYNEWVQKRNPVRYLENKEKDFDRKNMAHCVRLLTMGREIAKTGKVNVDRTDIDRDFILSIRLGNTDYDTIIKYAEKLKAEMDEAVKTCPLPDEVDQEKVNDILIQIRKTFYDCEDTNKNS